MTTPTKKTATAGQTPAQRSKIRIERTYQASLDDVWALWTTKEGLESWWGPEGFTTKVRTLELRPGGPWEYAMTATGPEQVEFMKRAGMPLCTTSRATYTEVVSRQRLSYDNLVDFIPGVAPYAAAVAVEFHPSPHGVRMTITLDAMHDQRWTEMARRGWESQLGRLAAALGG
jgi:uncharacterized protein YndB with AHSA1/START domain